LLPLETPMQKLTPARRRAFLAALRETGVFSRAARAASPTACTGAETTFRDALRRDPRFAAQVVVARVAAEQGLAA
jgi:hypothetical protein